MAINLMAPKGDAKTVSMAEKVLAKLQQASAQQKLEKASK